MYAITLKDEKEVEMVLSGLRAMRDWYYQNDYNQRNSRKMNEFVRLEKEIKKQTNAKEGVNANGQGKCKRQRSV